MRSSQTPRHSTRATQLACQEWGAGSVGHGAFCTGERPLIADVAAELVAAEPHFAETRLSFASKSRASKSRARP
eukprot:6209638-Pleurochrysis_carterae.AAC.3